MLNHISALGIYMLQVIFATISWHRKEPEENHHSLALRVKMQYNNFGSSLAISCTVDTRNVFKESGQLAQFMVALEEVVNKVLSEPIRPQFAIANVIGSGVDLSGILDFLAAKLGSKTPIIVSCAGGIMGRDAVTDEYKEVMIEDFWVDGASNSSFGIMLAVGFLPGLKVDAIPLLRPRKARGVAMVDKFVMDIMNFAASVSDSTSPSLIIMFGSEKTDQKPVMEKLDHAMSRETIVVGDERAQFLYRSGIESRNVYYGSVDQYFSDAVALVFARDQNRPSGTGEIHFHSALSSGVSTIGPRFKAVSANEIESETGLSTWLTVRREGGQEILGGQRIIDDINNELGNQTKLFIGVSEQRKCFVGPEKPRQMRSLAFHEVMGGDEEHLFVDGVGIKTGDYFHLYHSDPSAALSSCSNISKNFRNLKQKLPASCSLEVLFSLVGAVFEDVLRQPDDPRENLPKLVDPRLGDDYPLDSVCKMAQLARACTYTGNSSTKTKHEISCGSTCDTFIHTRMKVSMFS
ncbi:hypothetical protein D5086_007745 [Populus alba]|uniref:Uncharacterized protein n=1 Tax=Populus alba TaxID=43335 RepID=A0ACC4CDJ2_POPAL